MKKTIVILFAIAFLGLVGIYTRSGSQAHNLVSPSQTSAATTIQSSQPSSASSSSMMGGSSHHMSMYRDGTFAGASESNPYGTVQISVVISGGKISDVKFNQLPNDYQYSAELSSYAAPLLKQTTLQNQSANIDFVSGATATSTSYQASLQSALDQAVASSGSSPSTTRPTA